MFAIMFARAWAFESGLDCVGKVVQSWVARDVRRLMRASEGFTLSKKKDAAPTPSRCKNQMLTMSFYIYSGM